MKVLTIIMLVMSIIWAEDMNSKMILSSHIKSEEAAKNLYELEKFFYENKEANTLKKVHHLTLRMELLDKYILVMIDPIKMYSVENTLQHLLKEKFPDSFIVRNSAAVEISRIKVKQNTLKTNEPQKQIQILETEQKSFFSDIDAEWVALILLALAGLMLVYRSAQQLTKIRKLQKEIAKYQIILEDEVDSMEVGRG